MSALIFLVVACASCLIVRCQISIFDLITENIRWYFSEKMTGKLRLRRVCSFSSC